MNPACSGIAGGKQGIPPRLCSSWMIQKDQLATSWERKRERKAGIALRVQTLLKSRSTTTTDLPTSSNYRTKKKKKQNPKFSSLSALLYLATAGKVLYFKFRSIGEAALTSKHYVGTVLSEASKILKTFLVSSINCSSN